MKPFWSAFLLGLLLACAGIATFFYVSVSRRLELQRGLWELKPVLVLAKDVPMGHSLTFEDLSQRSFPAQFISPSMVPPAAVQTVLGQTVSMTMQAGDILLWASFADHSAPDACFVEIAPKVRAAGVTAREAMITRFGEQLGTPLAEPEPAAMPKVDASGEVSSIVVLTQDVPEGQVLEESMLAIGKRPSYLVTASSVPAEKLREVVGARAIVALQAKDALMWQMMDDAKQPRRVGSCILQAAPAQDEARARATREEAAAFVRGQEAH
jgi:Flp pilus assembly protein CpaB